MSKNGGVLKTKSYFNYKVQIYNLYSEYKTAAIKFKLSISVCEK